MTADRTGIRLEREARRIDEYPRPSHLTEDELLAGYAVRLDMLRGLGDAPCSPYKPRTRSCPCHAREVERTDGRSL